MIKELVTKKKLAAFAAALLLLPCLFAFAEDDDLQSQLSDVQSQMERQQQKKGEAEATIGNVFERLRVIQQNLDAAMKEYKDITAQIAETERKSALLRRNWMKRRSACRHVKASSASACVIFTCTVS